jgi:hypothetical protein
MVADRQALARQGFRPPVPDCAIIMLYAAPAAKPVQARSWIFQHSSAQINLP